MAKKKSKSKASAKPALASPSEQSENSEELDIADYENAVREIESIVARLESGEAELGDAIVDYERGIARLKQCHRILDLAQQRVLLLSGSGDGQWQLEPMPETEFRTGGGKVKDQQEVDGSDDLF